MPEIHRTLRRVPVQAEPAAPSRQERLEQFAKDRAARLERARAERDAELRRAEDARLAGARDKLAGFEDVAQAARQLARKRKSARRRSTARFAVCVVAPTLAAAYYLSAVATPFYEARATFVISAPDESSRPGSAGNALFSTARSGGLQDAFLARAYVLSPEVFRKLQAEKNVIGALSGADVDPLSARRLPFMSPGAPLDVFHRFVSVDVDIQEGLTTLRVRAPEPALAEEWTRRILTLAAARVESYGEERYSGAINDARRETEVAREALRAALGALAAAQVKIGETDPYARIAVTYEMIFQLERDRQKAEQELALLRLRYGDGNILVRRRAEEVEMVRAKLDEYRAVLNGGGAGPSLAARTASFDQARLDVELAKTTWQERLRSEEATRVSATRDRPVMSIVVPPHAARTPATPRIAESTALVFLVLAGIYVFLTILATSLRHHASGR
ncbi:MAG: hypothetical protein ACE5FS_08750 [Paracoccaceae bacterium]